MNRYALAASLKQHVMRKKAAIGSDGNEAPLEEQFGNLAHIYLQDKAPSLIVYEQGFQVVERNEDDTKVMGVMGFKVNGMQLYAPVFLINGELKGNELLRLADQNLWVPLKEPWLNEIYRRKPVTIGDSTPKDTNKQGLPDLSALADVPTKSASYKNSYDWNATYADLRRLKKRAASTTAATLVDLLNPVNHLKTVSIRGLRKAANMLQTYPMIYKAFEELHPGGYKAVVHELDGRCIAMNSIAKDLQPVKSAGVKKYANAVRFVSYSISISNGPLPLGLSDKEKEQLLRSGYVVQDERNDDEVSKIVVDNSKLDTIFNPGCTGMYEVLVSPTKTKKMVVLRSSDEASTYTKIADTSDPICGAVFVVDPSTKDAQKLPSRNVWCVEKYPHKDYLKWVDSLSDELAHGDDIFAVRGCCEVRGPFGTRFGNIRRGPKGSMFRDDGDIIVPEDFKTFHVNMHRAADPLIDSIHVSEFLPLSAKRAKIKEAAFKEFEPLKLIVKSGECVINNDRPIPSMDGLKKLIVDYGLRESDARTLFKRAEAKPHGAIKVMLKRGELFTPEIPDIGYAPAGMLTSRIAPAHSGSEAVSTDSSDMAPNPKVTVDSDYSSQDAAAVQKAIQGGQKEIFDLSFLKSIYTSDDTDSDIDHHISDLMKAMTQAGDLLFLFYWKGDQFKEIYGPKNLQELEGNLKKLFEVTGDVALFLKRNRLNKSDYDRLEPLNLSDNQE